MNREKEEEGEMRNERQEKLKEQEQEEDHSDLFVRQPCVDATGPDLSRVADVRLCRSRTHSGI